MSKIFMNPNDNDFFSQLRGLDLQELLVQTENYFLEYRDKLNLPNYVTFGVEIEYEGILKIVTDKYIRKKLTEWNSKNDGSLRSGGEITSPIMTDDNKYWQELKMVCKYLSKKNVDTLHNAGGHIHIGAHVLGSDVNAWKTFLKLYITYESVLFRFIYGDKISGRKGLFHYATPIADTLYEKLKRINEAYNIYCIRDVFPTDRYVALNFNNFTYNTPEERLKKNTLEFRSPNATTNAVIWQNNINAFAKMLLSAKLGVINEDFLDYKLEHEHLLYSCNTYLYNEVCLKNVLEFVDLVFDNNLDKIYFLRQYLKDFQDNYGIKEAVKAKRFVK